MFIKNQFFYNSSFSEISGKYSDKLPTFFFFFFLVRFLTTIIFFFVVFTLFYSCVIIELLSAADAGITVLSLGDIGFMTILKFGGGKGDLDGGRSISSDHPKIIGSGIFLIEVSKDLSNFKA